MAKQVINASFRVLSRLFSVLGNELIGKDYLAIFELVKNAYDADAAYARVELLGLKTDSPVIIVTDNGEGMDLDTIKTKWLELGSEHKKKQRENNVRTSKYKRLPIGEKGLGRFAVHKLGIQMKLVTRMKNNSEYTINIDWDKLIETKYLEKNNVKIHKSTSPTVFKRRSGTQITISDLRQTSWVRGDIRRLQRQITAICSPFDRQGLSLFKVDSARIIRGGNFKAELFVPDYPKWTEDMPDVRFLIDNALWRYSFDFNGKEFNWKYEFRPPPGLKLSGRKITKKEDKLLLPPEAGKKKRVVANESDIKGIGPLSGKLIAFDRDREVLRLLPESDQYRKFLDYHTGVRVYRDGIRVYNYGEPGDDWLGLDLRRVQRPTERLSRNIVVGEISLSLEESNDLKEKTNREGFDENYAFEQFKEITIAAITKFETERDLDKDRLKRLLGKQKDFINIPVEKPISDLRKELANVDKKISERLTPYVDQVEKDYKTMQELMLKAGMAGLNLAVIFHELERGLRFLYEAILDKANPALLEEQARNLMEMFESIAGLLKKKRSKKINIKEIVQHVARINVRRFPRHKVNVTYDLPGDNEEQLIIRAPYDLLLSALTNIIDNSIYWLRVRWPDEETDKRSKRKIHISISNELPGGKALVIADNGSGLQDDPDILTRPFFTRKPDGMGLGLYYASVTMQICKGRLMFPDKSDLELPRSMNGAVIALFFPEKP